MSYQWEEIDFDEPMSPGILSCQGCGSPIAMRHVLRVLGENTVVVIPACCWTIINGEFPDHSLDVPVFHTAFETAAATAAGMRAGLEANGYSDTSVLAWAGDGGTFDIGLQALSGAAERNENVLYICHDNEAYMNTGIQRSGATPMKAWTTTTPRENPNPNPKKDIMSILAAHQVPYAATASIAYPRDLVRKVQRAKETDGFRFLHVFVPCPPGWKMDSKESVNVARKAVNSRVFPLYEVENGDKWTLNYDPGDEEAEPVKEYLDLQGRFDHLSEEDQQKIQTRVDEQFRRVLNRHEGTHDTTDDIPSELGKHVRN